MTKNRITILISVYNGAATLTRCLKSVYTQTYKSFSVVLIDDYSSDDSVEIVKKFQRDFPSISIRIIKNKRNLGLTRSLNIGLNLIDSPYTARIDADDWWHPQKLEKQIRFMTAHPEYGVVGCNYSNHSKYGKRTMQLLEDDGLIRKNILKRNPFAHSCVIFKTSLIKKLGGYDESIRYAQDFDLWLRCMPHTKFYNVQKILCYRSLGQGISTKKQKQQMWQAIKIQMKYIKEYNLPLLYYFYTLELFANILTPEFIKDLKRRLVV